MNIGTFLENGRPTGGGPLPGPGVYSLKWNSFQTHITQGLSKLLEENSYTDVTLACDGNLLKAHKLLLTLCSPFFKRLFEANQVNESGSKSTIVILNHVKFKDLENIIRFIYNGQTNVNQSDLQSFLETGELLQIQGLASGSTNQTQQNEENANSNGSVGSNTASTPHLPPLPTLHSYPPRLQPQPATTTSNSNMVVNSPKSSTVESRLRTFLTNSNSQMLSNHKTHIPPHATQQQPPVKRPRFLNMGQTQPSSSSRLQSILSGQSYSTQTATSSNPIRNSPPVRSDELVIVQDLKDPLEQDDDVVHIEEEPDNIECEPLIEMGSVKSEPIHAYSLADIRDDDTLSDGEDEFEDSHPDQDINQTGNNLNVYHENMEIAGRQLGESRPTTSQSQTQVASSKNVRQSTTATATATSNNASSRISGALKKKPGRNARQKYRACTYCGGLFYRSNLSRHMSQVHAQILLAQGTRLFRCNVCRTLYRSTGHLHAHIQKQHNGDRQA